jgi:uncharacterized protein
MKASRYNLHFPSAEEGLHLVYNTLTEGTVMLSAEAMAAMSSDPGNLPEGVSSQLAATGILVGDGVDERRIFRVNHNRIKYASHEAYVMLYTTYACNAACTYCYEGFLTGTKSVRRAMDAEVTQAASRFMRNLAAEAGLTTLRLFFFGGEPLLNPEPIARLLDDLYPWAASSGVDLTSGICTNGTVPLGDLLPRIKETGTFIHFTLDGPRAVHDARRPYVGGRGSFDDTLRTIELVLANGVDFGIRINVDRENAPFIGALLEELRERLGAGIHLRFAEVIPPISKAPEGGSAPAGAGPAFAPGVPRSSCSWARQCLMGSSPRTLTSLMARAREIGFTVITRPLRDWVFCEFLRDKSFIIDPFGDLYKCEGLAGLKEHRAGTLAADGTLETGFKFYDWVSHDPLETRCGDCVYLPACGGGCPCLTYEEAGTYHSGGCTMFRSLLHGFIEYFLESAYPGLYRASTGEPVAAGT